MVDKRDLFAFIILYAVWIILAGDLSLASLVLGAIVAGTIDLIIVHSSFAQILAQKFITKALFFLVYSIFLALEVFIASYKVAYYVINPRSSFRSGIVKIPIETGKNNKLMQLTLLANTITLTPGTVTMDVDTQDKELYVHCLNIKSESDQEIKELIVGNFERFIRRIFT
ncbi:Na+/H+ antiporter subunit E [Halanaerobaculum tunisiense]